MSSFTGKSVIVTGGGGGLGKAIATSFVEAGAHVVICDVNEERLQATHLELAQKGSIESIKTDVTSPADVEAAINLAKTKSGRLDILINNAGIMDRFEPAGEASLALWNKVIAINLTGTFIFTGLAVETMLAQSPSGGAIVNVASAAACRGGTAGARAAMCQRNKVIANGIKALHTPLRNMGFSGSRGTRRLFWVRRVFDATQSCQAR